MVMAESGLGLNSVCLPATLVFSVSRRMEWLLKFAALGLRNSLAMSG